MKVAFSPVQTNYNTKNNNKQQICFSGTPEILENLAKGLHESQLAFNPNQQLRDRGIAGADAFYEAAVSDRAFPEFLKTAIDSKLFDREIPTMGGIPTLRKIINNPAPAFPVVKLPIQKRDVFNFFANILIAKVEQKTLDPLSHLFVDDFKDAKTQAWAIIHHLDTKK